MEMVSIDDSVRFLDNDWIICSCYYKLVTVSDGCESG